MVVKGLIMSILKLTSCQDYWVLCISFTLNRLSKRGYVAMLTVYEKIAPHLNPETSGV